jgi:hypothetical protein
VDVVAPSLSNDDARKALAAIEHTRPAGIRVISNITVEGGLEDELGSPPLLPEPAEEAFGPVAASSTEVSTFPVAVHATIVPTTLSLSTAERSELKAEAEGIVRTFFDDAGVGQTLVYNALVARLMALDLVLDVDLELFIPDAEPASTRRRNLQAIDPARRPLLAEPDGLLVQVGGAPLALDLNVSITLKDAGLVGDRQMNLDAAREELRASLADLLRSWPSDSEVSRGTLGGAIAAIAADTWSGALTQYKVDYVEAGVRILQTDPTVALTGLERMFIRQLVTSDGGAS